RVAPQAIISGRVLDEYGDPFMDVFVKAIPVAPEKILDYWEPPFFTNDRGEFRVSVQPGQYYILATSALPLLDGRTHTYKRANTAESTYLDTYYPNATDTDSATPVAAKAGREASGLEIRMARTPVLKISGVVTGTTDCTSRPFVVAASSIHGEDRS